VLSEILEGVEVISRKGNEDVKITSIEFDSRKCKSDSLFVAVKGTQVDGHDYIKQAKQNGAIVFLGDNEKVLKSHDIDFILANNSAKASGVCA